MNAENRQYMAQTDYLAWRVEADPILRSTIVAVAVLDRSPDWNRFVAMMDYGTRRVPNFRRRVVGDPIGLAPPCWVDDPDFDIGWHLRRGTLAEPGDMDAVLDFARTAGMSAFDKDRPLWEFMVLDGLESSRAALVMKVHHALTDGIGGMQIAREIVDFTRKGTARPDEPAPTEPVGPATVGPIDGLTWSLSTWGRIAGRAVPEALRASSQLLRHPGGELRSSAGLVASTLRFGRPILTRMSPVMTQRSTRRKLAVFDIPLRHLAHAGRRSEGSLNDAFLAAVLLGTAEYHRLHGSDIPELRMTLPISLRSEADPIGGNRITLARFALPANIDDPDRLIRRVHEIVERWRDEPALPWASPIAGAFNLLPASVLGAMFKNVDLLASNVVGSPVKLFIAGSEVLRYYAFGPTLGSAFNITLMSHVSQCCIGINADVAAVPDLERLVSSLVHGFDSVLDH